MTDRLGNERSPDLAELLRSAMSHHTQGLFVALPGRVETYDALTQTADVQPLLSRPVVFDDGSEDVDELPIIPSVPVAFPRGGGFFLTFPLSPGDNVLLVFCDRSIDKYKSSSGATVVDPVDLRTNDLSDAVAIPGFYPIPKAVKGEVGSNAVFGKELGTQLVNTGSTIEATTAGAQASVGGYVALAQKVDLLWTTLWGVFNSWIPPTSPTIDNGLALKTAFLAAFTTPPSTVASTNLKAD